MMTWLWPAIVVLCWGLWTFFSETSYRHGRWVAFLLPLFPLILLALGLSLLLARLIIYPLYCLRGRQTDYPALRQKIRAAFGLHWS